MIRLRKRHKLESRVSSCVSVYFHDMSISYESANSCQWCAVGVCVSESLSTLLYSLNTPPRARVCVGLFML